MGVDEKALGQRLQKARQKAGLTQQELCQKAGLSYSTLAKIERGAIRSPSVFTVAAIAGATDTTIEQLLDMKRAASPAPPPKKTSKTGIRFVYFDIDGVLLRYVLHAFEEIAQDTGVAADIVENLFWRYNDSVCRSEMTTEDFNAKMAKDLGIGEFSWIDHYLKCAQKTPGAEELLAWAAQHYEVGLLSNHMPGQTAEIIARGLIPDIGFKAVVDSCDVNAVKPETKLFEAAEQRAGFQAGEILLVDDTRPNLTAADRLGWQIVWFDELDPAAGIEKVRQKLAF